MIIEVIQNPHYIIDFNSYEGLRNIAITALLFYYNFDPRKKFR